MNLLLVVLFTLLGSIFSVAGAALLFLLREKQMRKVTNLLLPFAIGTLLGAAFLGMIPHALSRQDSRTVLATVLFGIILFYVFEKIALWRHCHEVPCEVHSRAGVLILIGDSFHNVVDGVAIAVAFAGSVPLGIATALAVIAHEVPQEVGDFAILLESGFPRSRALFWNALSSLAALPGAVLTVFLLPSIESFVPFLLAMSAASFIYIALADLVPGRRASGGPANLLLEIPLISAGIATIVAVRSLSSI